MKKRIEIKSISGDVLFGLDKRNNTIKDTLEEAVVKVIGNIYDNTELLKGE